MTLNSSTKTCQSACTGGEVCNSGSCACPTGEVKIDGICVTKVTCRGHQIYDSNTNTCRDPMCFSKDCYTLDPDKKICLQICGFHSTCQSGTCKCAEINYGFYMNGLTGSCKKCPLEQRNLDSLGPCVDFSCNPDQIKHDHKCITLECDSEYRLSGNVCVHKEKFGIDGCGDTATPENRGTNCWVCPRPLEWQRNACGCKNPECT